METPLNPLYCRKCKAEISASFTHCPHCGWDQRRPYDVDQERREAEAAARQSGQATPPPKPRPNPGCIPPETEGRYPPTPASLVHVAGITFLLAGMATIAYNLLGVNISAGHGTEQVVNFGLIADREVWTIAGAAYMVAGATMLTRSSRE